MQDIKDRRALAQGNGSAPPASPWSRTAERAVLGALLMDAQDVAPAVRDVLPNPGAFQLRAHQLTYAAILAMLDAGQAVDLVTAVDKLDSLGQLGDVGGVAYLSDLLSSCVTTTNVDHYARIVADHATRRDLMMTGYRLVSLAADEAGDLDGQLQDAAAAVQGVVDGRAGAGDMLVDFGDPAEYDGFVDYLERQRQGFQGIASGIEGLDTLLDGGLSVPSYTLIYGRPKVFKTGVLVNMARYVAKVLHQPVFIASGEMSRDQLRTRMLMCEGGWTKWDARKSRDEAPELARAMITAAGAIRHYPITFYACRGFKVSRILAAAQRAVLQRGAQLVLIENVDRIRADRPRQDKHENLEEISNALAQWKNDMASDGHPVAVVLFAHANREGARTKDGFPRLEDIGGSDQFSHDVDVAVALAAKDPTDAKAELGMRITGGRDVQMGTTGWVACDRARMRVGDWARPDVFAG